MGVNMNILTDNKFVIIDYRETFFICHENQFCLNGFVSFFRINDLWAVEFCTTHKDQVLKNCKFSFLN